AEPVDELIPKLRQTHDDQRPPLANRIVDEPHAGAHPPGRGGGPSRGAGQDAEDLLGKSLVFRQDADVLVEGDDEPSQENDHCGDGDGNEEQPAGRGAVQTAPPGPHLLPGRRALCCHLDGLQDRDGKQEVCHAAGLYVLYARFWPLTVLLRTVIEWQMSERLFVHVLRHVTGTRRATRGAYKPGYLRGRRYLPDRGAAGGAAGGAA